MCEEYSFTNYTQIFLLLWYKLLKEDKQIESVLEYVTTYRLFLYKENNSQTNTPWPVFKLQTTAEIKKKESD